MGVEIATAVEVRINERWQIWSELENIYTQRSYTIFSILADTRNQDKKYIPINNDSRAPDDVSKEGEDWLDEGNNQEGISYVYLEELEAYKWNYAALNEYDVNEINYFKEFVINKLQVLKQQLKVSSFDIRLLLHFY